MSYTIPQSVSTDYRKYAKSLMEFNNLNTFNNVESRLKEVLAVVNNKGGVGKTTTVQSLAAAMKRYRKDWRILVIDIDPQGDLSKLMGFGASYGDSPTVTDAMSVEQGRLSRLNSESVIVKLLKKVANTISRLTKTRRKRPEYAVFRWLKIR